MATLPYTKFTLIRRIKRHLADGFPNSDFTISDNEILLHLDSALAVGLIAQVFGNAKLENNLYVPDAYYVTSELPALQQDIRTNYWYSTLPQTPVSLPMGYAINRVYSASEADGISDDFLPIKSKRLSYRNSLPMAPGSRYWVENKKIWLAANNNSTLQDQTIYAQMATTRTSDINEDMPLPDDAIEGIFQKVIQICLQRYQVPQDVIADQLAAGNKSS